MRILTLVSIGCLLALPATCAASGIPAPSAHTVEFVTYEGTGPLTLLVLPSGQGPGFDAAADGVSAQTVDARLEVTLRDALHFPIANFPYEDIWLETVDGGLVACPGGTNADQNTDPDGVTYFTLASHAGGHCASGTLVMVNGDPVLDEDHSVLVMPLWFNSPDIDGDLDIDLMDLTFFVTDYCGGYDFRSDLDYDHDLGLTDLSVFTQAFFGDTGCP